MRTHNADGALVATGLTSGVHGAKSQMEPLTPGLGALLHFDEIQDLMRGIGRRPRVQELNENDDQICASVTSVHMLTYPGRKLASAVSALRGLGRPVVLGTPLPGALLRHLGRGDYRVRPLFRPHRPERHSAFGQWAGSGEYAGGPPEGFSLNSHCRPPRSSCSAVTGVLYRRSAEFVEI